MSAGSAAEALEAGEIPVLQGTEEDGPIKQVTPKYLIGKTQEELEEIVLSFGEVSFLFFRFDLEDSLHTLMHGGRINESDT